MSGFVGLERVPYLSTGWLGCIISSYIDRRDMELLDETDARREMLQESSNAWDAQAAALIAALPNNSGQSIPPEN